ncbi:hypothetical protein F0562_004984 [Nyssa sinensis]|uniref:Peroxidase n=1 Tax=Nyssa sinensis TaxID=561372 RepID=A0A5J5AGT9_9ASTE|nr:hypothetical protein F0562_004984 [Nyssa sinensis]
MALALLLILFLSSFSLVTPSQSQQLTLNYYQKSCPRFEQIVQDTITNKQITSPTTAAGTLRLFFHDCFVEGCDASVLASSTPFNKAERDADINLSLPGDGFDVIVRSKTALELACPGIVSCADILAVATRDLVTMMGGPYYNVKLGRKDGLVSKASNVEGNLPRPTMPMTQLIQIFDARGFSVQEMVALSGAHTIGFSHCKEFIANIYNYSKNSQYDPAYNPRYAEGLRNACADYQKNPTLSVFNDVMTPNKFDNIYFQNLPKGLGLLSSDHALNLDTRTRPYVEMYAANQNAFFEAFARAMEKLSLYGVKTGGSGEIRHRVLERYPRRLVTKNTVDIVSVIEFVVKAFRDLDDLRWVAVLDDDQVVLLEERPPHLQEIEVPDCGYDNVEFIFQ